MKNKSNFIKLTSADYDDKPVAILKSCITRVQTSFSGNKDWYTVVFTDKHIAVCVKETVDEVLAMLDE